MYIHATLYLLKCACMYVHVYTCTQDIMIVFFYYEYYVINTVAMGRVDLYTE